MNKTEIIGDDINDYWYLCANTGVIKYAGKFDDFDGVEQYFEDHGIDSSIWIFNSEPEVEEAR
mgnify:CR=1 FL=1|jgi:hypothetical protein